MSKNLKKYFAIALATFTMLSSLAGCGGSEQSASSTAAQSAASTSANKPEPVTLQFYVPSPTADVNDLKLVLDEFNKRTADTLNMTLNFNFTTFDDIGSKVSLKLSAGEQVDSVFSAQWTNPSLMSMVTKGQLVNLDKYFNNDTYSGLKKAFTQDYLKNNSFKDSNGEYHVYGIPFTHGFSGGGAIYYRQDLAEKYGIGEIKNIDDLTKYYDAILAKEKGMVPLSVIGQQDNVADLIWSLVGPTVKKHNYDTTTALTGMTGLAAAIKPDGTAYVAKTVNYRNDAEYMKLVPSEFSAMDPNLGYTIARTWYKKGYIEKDVMNQKDNMGQFMAGRAASFNSTLDVYADRAQQLTSSVPGAKLGYLSLDAAVRTETPKAMGSDFKAWNFACIPVTSKNADRTMQFYNWLFADQKNHDLFEFGIEGKHWTAEGTSKYSIPKGLDTKTSYNFPGFTLTWNPTMVRYSANTPDSVVKKLNLLADTNFYYKSPSAGFSFVPDKVKPEQAKLNELHSNLQAVGNGLIDNIPEYFAKLQKDYDKAGFQKYLAELEKQYTEYLKANPYQGD